MAISVVAHAVVLTALAVHVPKLVAPPIRSGPPEPIIPVLILPRVPPAHAGGPPAPIRLHRRALRHAPAALPVAPLVTPEPQAQPRPETPRPAQAVAPDPVAQNARQALRGLVGCANPASLSREEREKCDQQLARGGRDAPFTGLGIDRGKSRDLDRAAARREADFRYKRGMPGSQPRNPNEAIPWDTQRSPPGGTPHLKGMGQGAEDLGASLGNDRSTLKVPF
ncbi:hypothetical protein ACO2Q0_12525 [Phenylobacterium sp. VNQ135]|uniref:hypothetical protein n=1 Tax=Phenylobacterium sp. VNQ135 TaxID=3400922 RepID=UPI003C0B6AA2